MILWLCLKTLETIFGRFSKSFQTNSNLNLYSNTKTLDLLFPFSPFFSNKPTRGGERPAGDLLLESRDFLQTFPFVVYSLDSRGRRKPEALPVFHLSSLYSSTWNRPRPPVNDHHLLWNPTTTPLRRGTPAAPHAAPPVAMATVGTRDRPASHRPSHALSPRHQNPLVT
jgi:hypothetical protein